MRPIWDGRETSAILEGRGMIVRNRQFGMEFTPASVPRSGADENDGYRQSSGMGEDIIAKE